jgi:endonuclease YncB( thermonuclease family)
MFGLAVCLCLYLLDGNLPGNAQAPTPAAPRPASPQTNQTNQTNAPAAASADAKSKVTKTTNEDGSLRRITGKVKVLDAHTLVFADGTEVDLNGAMDAPDLEQKAMLEDTLYECGKVSAAFLTSLIGEQTVTFLSFGGKDPRPRGNCYAGETYIQETMVRHGWAVSSHSGTELAQLIAQEKKRGLWRGRFVTPAKWRKGERLPGE